MVCYVELTRIPNLIIFMATKTNKKPAKTKKVGFQRLSKSERARISAMGGKAAAKLRRKAKKG
jgi:hypothetical protein